MSDSPGTLPVDRFVNRQNIDRYRKLASEATDATQRQQIMRLLADEEAKFKLDQAGGDVDNTRQPEAGNKLRRRRTNKIGCRPAPLA